MVVLVIGGTGMVGGHFVNAYLDKGEEVYCLARNTSASRLYEANNSHIIRGDILERDGLMQIFEKIQPDLVIHMAAQAFNGDSWNCEYFTHLTNYQGTLNVLFCAKTLLEKGKAIKVLLACSSAEYGNITPEECPLKEETPLRPWTPYGVSKVGVEMLGRQYYLNYGMEVFLPRMFIHVGTGHPPATAIQNFARQLALIKKGKMPAQIHVGNLDTARDFIDVRDGVGAMQLLIEKEQYGIPINICNGKAYKIQDILDMLIEISETNTEIVSDAKLFRVADEPLLLGDNTKLLELGYKQRYSMYETLEAVFADWMKRV